MTETYLYNVGSSDRYSMLFRVWNDLLIAPDGESLDQPYVKASNISCPEGTSPYFKDHVGRVWTTDLSIKQAVEEKAYENEAGCYFSGKYRAGEYSITSSYRVFPPVECDDALCHLNLMLADKHIPYRNIEITLPESQIVKIFAHPPDLSASKNSGRWIIRGKSPENGLVEVEMLTTQGFHKYVTKLNNVEDKTVSANSQYINNYYLLLGMRYILIAFVLGFSLVLYLIYHRYGMEKEFTVPEYLSFIPSKRKPWFVNLVFKSDAFDFDENGFYATLLDLHKREFIKIEQDKEKNEVKIKLLKNPGDTDDPYEKDVLSFLRDWSKDGVFETEKV